MDSCDRLLPAYLRFMRGIVDSEDLPLNDTDAQLTEFWSGHGGAQSFPAVYVSAVETLLRAEDEVEQGDFAAARTRLDA